MTKVEIEFGDLTDTCFVIMPFSSIYNVEYTNIIRPAIDAAGLKCIRADEIYSKPQVTADLWKALKSSRVVIAELSGKNINVFYELGLAHALGKPTIIITRNEKDVPFDLKALRYLYYDINNPVWGDNLKNSLKDMIQSILKEKEYGEVFDGIKVTGTKSFENLPNRTPAPLLKNISGLWEGSMSMSEDDNYSINMDIKQNGTNLSAILTLSYYINGKLTKVQEKCTGNIQESFVILVGVSYTFIQQGESKEYLLDNFSGALKNGNEISGDLISGDGARGKFSLKKK